jgi:hypothetical protein
VIDLFKRNVSNTYARNSMLISPNYEIYPFCSTDQITFSSNEFTQIISFYYFSILLCAALGESERGHLIVAGECAAAWTVYDTDDRGGVQKFLLSQHVVRLS